MSVARGTQLRKKADQHQFNEQRTPQAKRSFGLVLLVAGLAASILLYFFPLLAAFFPIVGWAGYFAAKLFPDSGPVIIVVIIFLVKAICAAAAVWGISKLVSALRTPVKTVHCPFCGNSFGVFHDVKKTMCPTCGGLTDSVSHSRHYSLRSRLMPGGMGGGGKHEVVVFANSDRSVCDRRIVLSSVGMQPFG